MARPKNAREFFEVFRPPTDAKGKDDTPRRPEKEPEESKMGSSGPAEQPVEARPPADSAAIERAVQEPAPRIEPESAPQTEERDIRPAGAHFGLGGVFVAEQGRVVITLSNQAFAAGVLIILLFIALAFAAGNWRGSRAAKVAGKEAKTTIAEAPRPALVQPVPKKGHETGIVRREIAQAAPTAPKPTRESRTTPRPVPAPLAATPGPPEPTARIPYYALQVIAGINPNTAEKLKKELEQQGFPDVIVQQKGRYATVYLGRFEAKDSTEAKQFKKTLSEMKFEGKLQFKDCYIVKVE